MSTEITSEAKPKRTRKTAVKEPVIATEEVTPEAEPEQETAKSAHTKSVTYSARDIDLNQYVTVKNGYPGQLVYVSKRTGERFFWDGYGTEQDIQLMELRNVRNTAKKFFEHNWFVFDDEYDWVIDFLGVRAYYNNIINVEGIDALFKKTPAEIEKELASLSNGQKRTVAYRAMEMIREKEIDSLSVIEVLEKGLGIALVER